MSILTSSKKNLMAFAIFLSAYHPSVVSKGTQSSIFTKRVIMRLKDLEPVMDFRIVGGTEASIRDYPYMISLQINSNHICGGTILTKSFILTAAHCVTHKHHPKCHWDLPDPLDYNIVAGQTILDLGECQFRDVKKIMVHSGFNRSTMANDIALLEIFGTLDWTLYTQVAEIFSMVHPPFESYEYCIAIGWGSHEPVQSDQLKLSTFDEQNILQQVDLRPSLQKKCHKIFSPAPELFDATKLCVIIDDEKDACHGDSGGPFICNGVQYGITSFGLGCAQRNMPAVFTNISAFHAWIYGVLNNTETQVVSRMVEIVNLTRDLSMGKRNTRRSETGVKSSSILIFSVPYVLLILQVLDLLNYIGLF